MLNHNPPRYAVVPAQATCGDGATDYLHKSVAERYLCCYVWWIFIGKL